MLLATLFLLGGPAVCNPRPLAEPHPIPFLTPRPDHYDPQWYQDATAVVRARDPERDAASALQRGDCRVAAIVGYAPEAPGLDTSLAIYQFGYYYFQGTSDSIGGEDQVMYTRVAFKYAKRYNRSILAHARASAASP